MNCVVVTIAINKTWTMVLLESISYLTKDIIKGDVSITICVVGVCLYGVPPVHITHVRVMVEVSICDMIQ